jgi:hypothetical protein
MKGLRFLLILIILPGSLLAQKSYERTWEIPFFLGASNYLGDLAPDIAPQETRIVLGAGIKRVFNGYFSASLMFNYGMIGGHDANFKSLAARNLSFQSQIFEFGPQFEFNFFRLSSLYHGNRFTPYLYTGFVVFHFDPTADFDGKTFHLQNLSTEGEGIVKGVSNPYKLWSEAIPIGAGFKYKLSPQWMLALHGAWRTTFTDYLDDVSGLYADKALLLDAKGPEAVALSDRSGEKTGEYNGYAGKQRGSRDTKDWYIFAGFTLSYIIQKSSCYSF